MRVLFRNYDVIKFHVESMDNFMQVYIMLYFWDKRQTFSKTHLNIQFDTKHNIV